jgi:O-antigen/teichoic acid export membrane protein
MDSFNNQRKSVTEASSYMLYAGAIRKAISDTVGRLKGADIKAKSARAVVALSIGTFAGRGMRFVRSIILAHILVPDQIGIMAIVMSFSIAFEALTEVGVKQSIIQNKRGADTNYLNVAWWIQVVRALCLYGIAVLSAPLISSFYGNPDLLKLLRVAFLAIALRGFISPRAHVLEKEYKFGRAVFLIQGSAILGAIITIGLALVIRNVWALVIGFVAEMAILCILSFVLVPFLPRFHIDRKCLSELMKYASQIFGLPVLAMLSFQTPIMVLGKVISEEQLGLYSFASLFAYIPIELFIKIISPILLPAFSEKQDDNKALCRGLIKVTWWAAFFSIPSIAFLACCSSELLLLAYGPPYVTMAITFAVLCFEILARNEATILAGLYLAIGLPHLQRRFAIIRAVFIIGLIYPAAAYFGPLGAAVVIVLSNFAILFMQAFKTREVIGLKFGQYLCSYIPGLLMALPIVVNAGLLWVFNVDYYLYVLAISTLVFAATFAAGLFIVNRPK